MKTNSGLLTQWATDSQKMLWEYVNKCEGILNSKPNYDTKSEFVLAQLYYSCYLVSESSIILVENRRSWDAQILTRSVAEGTFRYVYLCTKNKADHEQRVREFMEDLPDLNQIKEYEKIKTISTKTDKANAKYNAFNNYVHKYGSYTSELRNKFPKSTRDALSGRWSLTQILISLAKDNFPEIDRYVEVGLRYAMGSHFVHQDADALHALWMRNNPKETSPMFSEVVIGAKVLVENLDMAHLRSMAIHHFLDKDPSKIENIYKKHTDLLLELSKTTEYATNH